MKYKKLWVCFRKESRNNPEVDISFNWKVMEYNKPITLQGLIEIETIEAELHKYKYIFVITSWARMEE